MKNPFKRFSWIERILLAIFAIFLFTSIALALNLYSFIGDLIIDKLPFSKSIPFLDNINKPMKNNYFVSISSPLWSDEIPHCESNLLLQCGGVILDKNSVLTGQCMKREEDFTKFFVRFNSNYWSLGGTIHTVKSFEKRDNFYVLKINPPFNMSQRDTLPSFDQKLVSTELEINYKDWTNIIYKSWTPIDNIQGLYRYNKATERIINLSKILHKTCDISTNQYCKHFGIGSILIVNKKLILLNAQPGCNIDEPIKPHLCGFKLIY